MEKYPNKISPSPIIEAVIDIRFRSNNNIPTSALFGLLFNEFRQDYPASQELPIVQIPAPLREKDPNLKDRPLYQLMGDDFILQIGVGVIVLINRNNTKEEGINYVGWARFKAEIEKVLKWLESTKVVEEFLRVGLRYIDYFDIDIFGVSTVEASLAGTPLRKGVIRSEIEVGAFTQTLLVSNSAEIVVNGEPKKGSVIDIDTFINNPLLEDRGMESLLEAGHMAGKKTFFDVLGEPFIESLKPEY